MINSHSDPRQVRLLFGLIFLFFTALPLLADDELSQITTPRIEKFPKSPRGYKLIDWNQRASDFVRFTLDPSGMGEYLPLMWWDDTKIAGRDTTFGLPSYVGMKGQWAEFRNSHEAFVTMSVLISGTLIGHDMTKYVLPGSSHEVNLVRMQKEYFSPKQKVFCDLINGDELTGETFFYELLPSVFAAPLCAKYSEEVDLTDKWHQSCQAWSQAAAHLWILNDYNFQAYDLMGKRAVVKDWREPDSAAGLAYLMLLAHAKWPAEQEFYHECHHALTWLDNHPRNINYGITAPFGVYAAARSNAENGSKYNVTKFFGWCFESSEVRGISPHAKSVAEGDDYGIISGRWGDHDIAGLVGASRIGLLNDQKKSLGRGGYVFAMETFAHAWPLVPAVRYDNQLARSVGKWMYHAAHSARLFYPDQLATEMQTNWNWAKQYSMAIPYEGLKDRNTETGLPGPYGCGDPTTHDWGPNNLGLYSGGLSGVFGAIVKPTDVEGVLALDTRSTDFFASDSLPTTLLYNPMDNEMTVTLSAGETLVRVWEAVGNKWLTENPVRGNVKVSIPADAAIVVSFVPAEAKIHFDHGRLYAGGTVVDYSVTAPAPK